MKLIAPCTHGVEVGHRRGLRHRKHQMSRRGQAHKRAVHSSSCLGLGPGKQQSLKSPRSHSVGDPCCACTSRGDTEARKRDSERQNASQRSVAQHETNMEGAQTHASWLCAGVRALAGAGIGRRMKHGGRGREIGVHCGGQNRSVLFPPRFCAAVGFQLARTAIHIIAA